MTKEGREKLGLKDRKVNGETKSMDLGGLEGVLASLKYSEDSHWTKAGLPNIHYLNTVLQSKFKRSDIDFAAHGLTRDSAED